MRVLCCGGKNIMKERVISGIVFRAHFYHPFHPPSKIGLQLCYHHHASRINTHKNTSTCHLMNSIELLCSVVIESIFPCEWKRGTRKSAVEGQVMMMYENRWYSQSYHHRSSCCSAILPRQQQQLLQEVFVLSIHMERPATNVIILAFNSPEETVHHHFYSRLSTYHLPATVTSPVEIFFLLLYDFVSHISEWVDGCSLWHWGFGDYSSYYYFSLLLILIMH